MLLRLLMASGQGKDMRDHLLSSLSSSKIHLPPSQNASESGVLTFFFFIAGF